MLMEKSFITKEQLRRRGFTHPDAQILPFLEILNIQASEAIDAEISLEIKQNHSEDMLREWQEIRAENELNSYIAQEWLVKNVPAIQEIITENCEIILHRATINLNRDDN